MHPIDFLQFFCYNKGENITKGGGQNDNRSNDKINCHFVRILTPPLPLAQNALDFIKGILFFEKEV